MQQTGWEVLSSGEYGTPTAIYESEYTYETYTGRRSLGTFTNPTHGPWTENYTYDADLGYLTSVDYNDGADQVQSWTYDAAGNRISDSKYSGGGTWTYDNLNRMEQSPKMSSTGGASPWSYQYDAMGNRLSRNYEAYGTNIIQDDDIALYEWDAVNRLTKTTNEANGASFRYRGRWVAGGEGDEANRRLLWACTICACLNSVRLLKHEFE